jgi:hypothetical protein
MFLMHKMSYRIYNKKCPIFKLNPDMMSSTITMSFDAASEMISRWL